MGTLTVKVGSSWAKQLSVKYSQAAGPSLIHEIEPTKKVSDWGTAVAFDKVVQRVTSYGFKAREGLARTRRLWSLQEVEVPTAHWRQLENVYSTVRRLGLWQRDS